MQGWGGRGPAKAAPIVPPETSPHQRGLQRRTTELEYRSRENRKMQNVRYDGLR